MNSMSYDEDNIFVDELIGEGLPDLEEEINKMKKESKQQSEGQEQEGQDDTDIFAIPDQQEDSIFSIPRQTKDNRKDEEDYSNLF